MSQHVDVYRATAQKCRKHQQQLSVLVETNSQVMRFHNDENPELSQTGKQIQHSQDEAKQA